MGHCRVSDLLSPHQKTGSLTNFTECVCSYLQMLLLRQVGYLMHNPISGSGLFVSERVTCFDASVGVTRV